MLKTTRSSIASASRVDDNKIVGSVGDIGAENGESVGGSDTLRKKSTKSKNWTKYTYFINLR